MKIASAKSWNSELSQVFVLSTFTKGVSLGVLYPNMPIMVLLTFRLTKDEKFMTL